ncbi:BnaA02g19230D [Brassica napus]|uniref:BnaA02g19230D protein n=2 Tax=Brassica TaxID=3705 RepID=A0A078IJZ3_BRANA|nr:BnaA02g19230D [Brassica napus]VDC61827.1 unnamed protein product [Brassica rapa]
MLLVDVNATMMQATISAHRVPRYQERLTAGAMYSMADFDVARCAQNFRLSFWFRDQSELIGLANTSTQLPVKATGPTARMFWTQFTKTTIIIQSNASAKTSVARL